MLYRACVVLATMAFVAGCSSSGGLPTAKVTGKVTYRDKPVPNGTVMFVPEGDKPAATGEIQPDGTYELSTYGAGDGAVLGPHTVMITAVAEMADALPEQRSGTPALLVPLKYANNNTSGLTAEVKDEPNTFNFDLKD